MRLFVAALAVAPVLAFGQANAQSPVGLWRTIDDATGRPRALVRVFEQDGYVFGRIEKGLAWDAPADAVCALCTDERRDQPKIGMIIIRNMQREGDVWGGGDILDPDNGRVYNCRLQVVDDNRTLEVRGFTGLFLLGRTQMWERVE